MPSQKSSMSEWVGEKMSARDWAAWFFLEQGIPCIVEADVLALSRREHVQPGLYRNAFVHRMAGFRFVGADTLELARESTSASRIQVAA